VVLARGRHLATPCHTSIPVIYTAFCRAMCPPYRTEPRTPSPENPIQHWLDTAICCHTLCHRHRVEKYIICNACFAAQSDDHRAQYVSLERHFVHLGAPEELDECSFCDILITQRQFLEACSDCRYAVDCFAIYLRESGDTPYESDSPTIIALEQITGNALIR